MDAPLEVAAGAGGTSFDLTPGAPSAHWQSGTTEPTLLRIRGYWGALPRSVVNLTQGGAREQRQVAMVIAWRSASNTTLDPFSSSGLSSEDILYHDVLSLDTRDFAMPASGSPINPFTVNVAGPGVIHLPIDVKAKRRVRSEEDRLIISFRAIEIFTQSTPPNPGQASNISALAWWGLRFLYRTSR